MTRNAVDSAAAPATVIADESSYHRCKPGRDEGGRRISQDTCLKTYLGGRGCELLLPMDFIEKEREHMMKK